MITAEQAYARTVLGDSFRRQVEKEIKKAISRNELYFKLPYDIFPENKNIDEIMKALVILGYRFIDSKDGSHCVIDFSWGWMDETPQEDA